MLWAVGAATRSVFLLAVLIAAAVLDWIPVPLWVWPVYAVVSIAYVVAMPRVRYRIHRWESTDTAVCTQTGWLSRERRIAPMSRVQTVDFEQSPLGRLLGLASVVCELGPTRLGVCSAAPCTNAYVDTSPNQSRRYCSDRCSSRANVAAYRARQREIGAGRARAGARG